MIVILSVVRSYTFRKLIVRSVLGSYTTSHDRNYNCRETLDILFSREFKKINTIWMF